VWRRRGGGGSAIRVLNVGSVIARGRYFFFTVKQHPRDDIDRSSVRRSSAR